MSDIIRPPVLISRLLTFVCAGAIVMLAVLTYTLWNMFPLDRPEVFFLANQPRPDMELRLYAMPTKSTPNNIELYKEFFIKEYLRARNEIVSNADTMHRKWGNDDGGIVNAWSHPDIYQKFTETRAYDMLMREDMVSDDVCTVEFTQARPQPRKSGRQYAVPFNYICVNSDGQATRKDYTIVLSVEPIKDNVIKWGDRMTNPLGMWIVGYEIESGDGDPLNF